MAVEHEFNEEELREFAQHGVIISQPAAAAQEEQATPASPAPPEEQLSVEGGAQQPRDPATGQFAPKPGESAPEAASSADASPADASPADASAPPAPPPGFVPHQALHQERALRQHMAQQLATLQARTNALLAARQPQAPELPDLEQDPVGYVRALGENFARTEEERQIEAFNQRVDTAINEDEAAFRAYNPDYDEASSHYVQSRAQELLAFYPREQAQQIMLQEARQLAQEAWRRGVPAAQMVYTMAQARGYRAGSAQTPSQTTPATPAPAPVATPQSGQQQSAGSAPSPSAVVAAARQGQQATRSLSGGAGGGVAELNAEALLSMSDEEFEQVLKLGQKGANARFAAIG